MEMAEQKEILESIRDIISGKAAAVDEDILELTQMVNPDGSVSEIKKAAPVKPPISESKPTPQKPGSDVLNDIDSLLNDGPKLDKKIELEFAPKPEKFEISEEFSQDEQIAPRKDNKMEKSSDTIISPESAETAKTSIAELASRLRKDGRETNKVEPSAPFRSGATVEDLVVEMLKPMMKDWLDKNLPKLVNEIVQKEIQKLIPRE